jgi:tetrapyrrole methylase family protein/MazG family protein
MRTRGITIIGLGPGDPSHLTRRAWQLLQEIDEIYLRTRMHPVVAGFPADLRVHSFDQFYEEGVSFDEVYDRIIEKILTLGERDSGVVYGVPGHPFVAEITSPEIFRRATEADIPVEIVEGLSFLEPTFTLLGLDPLPQIVIIDALELAASHHPHFSPNIPALIAQIHSPMVASDVKLTLMANYPDDHKVQLVHGAGTANPTIEYLPLYKIDRSQRIGLLTSLFLPPLPALSHGRGFRGFRSFG